MSKLLLVEDDVAMANLVADGLRLERHSVDIVHTGREAEVHLKLSKYDVIILDIILPDISGIEVCKRFKANHGRAHVLMLTIKSTLDDRVEGLDSGADDYLTKPFEIDELTARVRALLRRPADSNRAKLHCGDLLVNISDHEVVFRNHKIELSPREFDLLEFLARYPDQPFDADTLRVRVWEASAIQPGAVTTTVARLRQKLVQATGCDLIATVPGRGYKLEGRQN
jgi:DNA-binding response OmpR family regulator